MPAGIWNPLAFRDNWAVSGTSRFSQEVTTTSGQANCFFNQLGLPNSRKKAVLGVFHVTLLVQGLIKLAFLV